MKKILFLCLLLPLSTLMVAQVPLDAPRSFQSMQFEGHSPDAARSSGTQGWLYSHSITYRWDDVVAVWDTSVQFFYTYDALERPDVTIGQQWTALNGFTNATRQTTTYTPTGKILQSSSDFWDNGQWLLHSQLDYGYDSLDNVVRFIFQSRNGANLDTLANIRTHYTYDNMGRILRHEEEEIAFMTTTWEPTVAFDYTYGSGTGWESETFSYWTSNNWLPARKTRDVQWVNFEENQPLSYFEDSWNQMAASWIPATEDLFTYGPNGGQEHTVKTYDANTSTYEFTDRWSSSYNMYGDVLQTWNYSYDDSAMAWVALGGQNYIHTYNPDDNLVESILQYYNTGTGQHENEIKYEYLDYALDVPVASSQAGFVQWVPHPVGQAGILQVDGDRPGKLLVEVMDMQGRLVKSYSLSQQTGLQRHQLDLGLEAGAYVYRAILNGRSSSGKLLIR